MMRAWRYAAQGRRNRGSKWGSIFWILIDKIVKLNFPHDPAAAQMLTQGRRNFEGMGSIDRASGKSENPGVGNYSIVVGIICLLG